MLIGIVGTGCSSIPKTTRLAERISQPPPGKALVNFHRPSNYGAGRLIAIFDGNGKMLIDLPVTSLFQHVCDPGERVFMVWDDRVSVVKAELAPDKVYDIRVDISDIKVDLFMGWVRANIVLTPLRKNDSGRAELAGLEKQEKRTLSLNSSSPRVAEHEAKSQMTVADINKDFLTSQQADCVKYLQKDDCR